jgi:hypothetical protein
VADREWLAVAGRRHRAPRVRGSRRRSRHRCRAAAEESRWLNRARVQDMESTSGSNCRAAIFRRPC